MGQTSLYTGEKVPSVQRPLSGSSSQNLRTDRWGQEELWLLLSIWELLGIEFAELQMPCGKVTPLGADSQSAWGEGREE